MLEGGFPSHKKSDLLLLFKHVFIKKAAKKLVVLTFFLWGYSAMCVQLVAPFYDIVCWLTRYLHDKKSTTEQLSSKKSNLFISSEHTAGILLEIAPAIKNRTQLRDPSAYPNYIFGLMWTNFAFNQTQTGYTTFRRPKPLNSTTSEIWDFIVLKWFCLDFFAKKYFLGLL